ncbi:hypothetical protein TRVA0_068S00232 [Trichomonascus vanleenenianus]|uniref:uncharacterized protein n=1 Tax=Trichomonascus vanleenenianus TaxID=2268995 RepID=UPI003ECA4DDA
MISKLSVVTLALAVAGALGQQCTLSTNGNTVVNAMNTLTDDNNALQQAIAAFEEGPDNNSVGYNNAMVVYNQQIAVANDLAAVSQALSSYESELTDCDFTTFINLLSDTAPTLTSNIQSITADYNNYLNAGSFGYTWTGLQSMTVNSVQLISTVYSSLPGCEYTDQTSDAINGINGAVASAQSAYEISGSIPPANPCATTTTAGSTPTSPPTCSKKQAKRAN